MYWPCCRNRKYKYDDDEEYAAGVERETRAARAQEIELFTQAQPQATPRPLPVFMERSDQPQPGTHPEQVPHRQKQENSGHHDRTPSQPSRPSS